VYELIANNSQAQAIHQLHLGAWIDYANGCKQCRLEHRKHRAKHHMNGL